MAVRIELRSLLESVGRGIDPRIRRSRFGADPFTDAIGFHIYGELHLSLKLTAAQDTSDAARLLRILQEYALIAEACAAESTAVLLEVQGERIHLLLPAISADRNSVEELIRFSIAFTNAVYDRISKSAGTDFLGFKMAADHGRAILIGSGGQVSGSIVSLGPAANAPAKQLKRYGVAAHLRLRSDYAQLLGLHGSAEWTDIPVQKPSANIARLASRDLLENFANRSNEYYNNATQNPVDVRFADASFLESFAGGYINRSMKIQGFPLRADLDGFSKVVEIAFRQGEQAIAALVTRFLGIMRYPEEFRRRFGKTVDLPWAGDCATVIVLPNGFDYDDSREYLPVTAAAQWHSQRGAKHSGNQNWSDYLGNTKWTVGIAGGNSDEGANGYVLVAPIAGRHRDFMVAAGWGIGRSLDAQESDGTRGDDTIIPSVDYASLATTHKSSFQKLNSNFWISHNITVQTVRDSGVEKLASSSPLYVPTISTPLPQPRPWCERA